MHRREKPAANLEHFEFLADDDSDSRQPFLESLFNTVKGAATIVVYNQVFEEGRLIELAGSFPQHATKIARIRTRLWDLLPFVRENIYHRDFQGSFSLKRVLPALVPDMSYEKMRVCDGGEAGLAWQKMLAAEPGTRERQQLRESLLEYCGQDTLAMVRVVDALGKLAKTAARP